MSKTDWIDLNVQFDDAKSREAGKAAVGCIDMNVLWTEGVDRDPVSASQQRPLDGWMDENHSSDDDREGCVSTESSQLMLDLFPSGAAGLPLTSAWKLDKGLNPDACRLNKRSSMVLRQWFEDNKDWPYPNSDVLQELSATSGASLMQVKNFFMNTRRSFRKRCREVRLSALPPYASVSCLNLCLVPEQGRGTSTKTRPRRSYKWPAAPPPEDEINSQPPGPESSEQPSDG